MNKPLKSKFKIGDTVEVVKTKFMHEEKELIYGEKNQQFGYKKGTKGIIKGYTLTGDVFQEEYWVNVGKYLVQISGKHLK